MKPRVVFLLFLAPLLALLPACSSSSSGGGGAKPKYSIGGTVTGLPGGGSVTLQLNGAESITITADGSYTFNTRVEKDKNYTVTVQTPPVNGTATLTNASGKVGNANITNVGCTVAPAAAGPFTVSGTITGIPGGESVELDLNGVEQIVVNADGAFNFPVTMLNNYDAYAVTVATQPASAFCQITNGSGTVFGAAVTDVTATCDIGYTVGGTLSGLPAGSTVSLQLNGGAALVLNADGAYTFPEQLFDGQTYDVTVSAQPVGATCTLVNASGTVAAANVTDVDASCALESYAIGGMLTNLPAGDSVTLQNNGGDDLVLTANGAFSFATPVQHLGAYNVTVSAQPTGATCVITMGSGTVNGAAVTDVAADCPSYTVGGTLTGLPSGDSVTLQNNGGDDLVLTADGPFEFATEVYDGQPYAVTVSQQPMGATCLITNGSGTIAGAAVNNVNASCKVGIFLGMDTTPVNRLREVNRLDGMSTPLSSDGVGAGDFDGMAQDPNTATLYGVRDNGGTSELWVIGNSGTGSGLLGNVTGAAGITGLAFDAATSTLYGFDNNAKNLVSIDTGTRVATVIGSPSGAVDVHSLAFEPGSPGVVWAFDNASTICFAMSTATGTAVANFSPPGTPNIRSLAWDPVGGRLVAFNAVSNALFSLPVPAGPASQIGPVGFTDVEAMTYDSINGRVVGLTNQNTPDNSTLIEVRTVVQAGQMLGTSIGSTGFDGITAMGYDETNAQLWGYSTAGNMMLRIDEATGACTPVNPPGVPNPLGAMTWDGVNGFGLLAIEVVPGAEDRLLQVNTTTGACTPIDIVNQAGYDIQGAAFDPASGLLYLAADNGSGSLFLMTLDLNGSPPFTEVTVGQVSALAGTVEAMAWDAAASLLYAVNRGPDQLMTIDTATASPTVVAPLSENYEAAVTLP